MQGRAPINRLQCSLHFPKLTRKPVVKPLGLVRLDQLRASLPIACALTHASRICRAVSAYRHNFASAKKDVTLVEKLFVTLT